MSKFVRSDSGGLATKDTYLRTAGNTTELGGSGVFVLPFGLRGPQKIDLVFEIGGSGFYDVMLCGDRNAGYITCALGGHAYIYDSASRINDSLGEAKVVIVDRKNKLGIRHDGKGRLVVKVNGEQSALMTRLGSRVSGAVGLAVHSSRPCKVHALRIEGFVDPANALQLRESFVDRALRQIWP